MGQLNIGINITIDMCGFAGGDGVPWYLTDTVESSDVIGAWQGKGAASYAASLVNLNDPGTQDLIEIVGTVPWTVEEGWLFDATNWLNTGFTESGAFHSSHIFRFRRANHDGSSVFYSDKILDKCLVNRIGGATLEVYHHSPVPVNCNTADLLNPANDFVLAINADDIYCWPGSGPLEGTIPSYSIAAAAEPVAFGGAGLTGGGTGIDIYASVIYNRKLTETEVLAVVDKMQAL